MRPGGRCQGGDLAQDVEETLDWATLAAEQVEIYERVLAADLIVDDLVISSASMQAHSSPNFSGPV